ncbi:MAG: LytR/AlgR family response regulator transcription factor [Runella zeae]
MENTLNCIIVDDEPPAQQVLENFISRLPFLNLLQKCNDAYMALNAIHQHSPDLIFLDINMPEMSGIDLLKSFARNSPQVIVTTAYRDYALEGFEYDVTDYLLKPVPFERFLKAVNKARERFDKNKTPKSTEATPASVPPVETNEGSKEKAFIWIKEGRKLLHIQVEDILFVEGMKDYVKVYLNDKPIVTYLSMNKMEEMLPSDLFLRVHRSYLVNKSCIKVIQGNTLETTISKEIPIGVSYREIVQEFVNGSLTKR